MKTTRFYILSLVLAFSLVACATRGTFNTLAIAEQSGKSSYDAFVDGVIKGTTPTNNLPAVSEAFNIFQLSIRTAVDAASGNTNAPVTPAVTAAQTKLTSTITAAKTP